MAESGESRIMPAHTSVGYCPVCDSVITRWAVGPKNRPNERCPRCGSVNRNRLLVLGLDALDPLLRSSSVLLDVAPSRCMIPKLRERVGVSGYISFDLGLDERPVDVYGDLTQLPFVDGSIDVLVAFHVLEHIPDDRLAMREIRRVIGDRGIAVLQVPFRLGAPTDEDPAAGSKERIARFGQRDHVRLYGDRDFEQRLADVGLRVSRFIATEQFPSECAARMNVKGRFWLATGVDTDPSSPHAMVAAVAARRSGHVVPSAEGTIESLGLELARARRQLHETKVALSHTRVERDTAVAATAKVHASRSYRLGRAAIAPLRLFRSLQQRLRR